MPRIASPQVRRVWRDRLRRFQKTSTTVAKFCEAEQVSLASFYGWRRKLQETRDDSDGNNSESTATFLAVNVALAQADVRVMLPGGAVLELGTGLSKERLQQVIAATVQATAEQTGNQQADNSNSNLAGRHAC